MKIFGVFVLLLLSLTFSAKALIFRMPSLIRLIFKCVIKIEQGVSTENLIWTDNGYAASMVFDFNLKTKKNETKNRNIKVSI